MLIVLDVRFLLVRKVRLMNDFPSLQRTGLFHSKETFDSVETSLATALSLSHIGEVVVAV